METRLPAQQQRIGLGSSHKLIQSLNRLAIETLRTWNTKT
jgi:hypothetical protein